MVWVLLACARWQQPRCCNTVVCDWWWLTSLLCIAHHFCPPLCLHVVFRAAVFWRLFLCVRTRLLLKCSVIVERHHVVIYTQPSADGLIVLCQVFFLCCCCEFFATVNVSAPRLPLTVRAARLLLLRSCLKLLLVAVPLMPDSVCVSTTSACVICLLYLLCTICCGVCGMGICRPCCSMPRWCVACILFAVLCFTLVSFKL